MLDPSISISDLIAKINMSDENTDLSSDFILITSLPFAEFTGETIIPIVEEVIAMTNSGMWVSHRRRQAQAGDLVVIKNTPWLLLPKDGLVAVAPLCEISYVLTAYPNFGIVKLPNDIFVKKTKKCDEVIKEDDDEV
jgi:hypothetical protein